MVAFTERNHESLVSQDVKQSRCPACGRINHFYRLVVEKVGTVVLLLAATNIQKGRAALPVRCRQVIGVCSIACY